MYTERASNVPNTTVMETVSASCRSHFLDSRYHSTLATLEMAQEGGRTDSSTCFSCFGNVWDALCNCLSWLLPCFQFGTDAKESRLREIANQEGYIWFYEEKQNQLTAFLGNFYPCRVSIYGITFQCAESAFQAAKFYPDRTVMASFANLTGDQAFKRARALTAAWSQDQRDEWQNRNLDVMRQVLIAKFSQNEDLKRLLLATQGAHLVEHVPVIGRDAYWADNGDGTGLNMLGILAMETRENLGGQGIQPRPVSYNPMNCR